MARLLFIFLHVAALAVWLGSLAYLPLLFAAHAGTGGEQARERVDRMLHTLYFAVASPAAVLTVIFGIVLIFHGIEGGWLPVKLALVLLLVMFHLYCGRLFRELVHGEQPHGIGFYRAVAWLPVLLSVPIVALVAVKPF